MAEQKLATPELTVIAAAVDGLAPPAVLERDDQINALWEGCVLKLTTWTSGAFLLHGGSGSGKTTCLDALLRDLRPVAAGLAQHCRIDIVELDIVKMRVPNDLLQTLISHFEIAEDDDPYQAVRAYIAEQANYMLILAVENIDIGLQNQEWIDTLAQICHLATIGELVMIGAAREIIGLVAGIPVQHIDFPPYVQTQTDAVLQHMLLAAELPADAFHEAARHTCSLRFVEHPEEIHIFYHVCSEALKKSNTQPAPLQLGEPTNVIAELRGVWVALQEIQEQPQIEDRFMVQVFTEVDIFRFNYRQKAESSKLLDLLILKLVLRNTLRVPAQELMFEYNTICQEKHTQPKTYQQVKVMCGHHTTNGGMRWKRNALIIPVYPSFIMQKKFVEVRAVALGIPEEEAPEPEP